MISAGADVNHKNALGFTPLEVAATVGHCRVLRIFVKHPEIQLDSQVNCSALAIISYFCIVVLQEKELIVIC